MMTRNDDNNDYDGDVGIDDVDDNRVCIWQ